MLKSIANFIAARDSDRAQNRSATLNLTITDAARKELEKAFADMKMQNPALRILFKGFG